MGAYWWEGIDPKVTALPLLWLPRRRSDGMRLRCIAKVYDSLRLPRLIYGSWRVSVDGNSSRLIQYLWPCHPFSRLIPHVGEILSPSSHMPRMFADAGGCRFEPWSCCKIYAPRSHPMSISPWLAFFHPGTRIDCSEDLGMMSICRMKQDDDFVG